MKTRLLLAAVLGLLITAPAQADCVDALPQVQAQETRQLLQNAPAFRHGWEDGGIQLRFDESKASAQGCSAQMHLTLPQADLDQVHAYLEQNPAKRILLAAQGYEIPQSNISTVEYHYSPTAALAEVEANSNRDLQALHHSVEFIYQLLTQLRAEVSPGAQAQEWPADRTAAELKACQASYAAEQDNLQQACSCRQAKLSAHVSARQMELVRFLQQQPYSASALLSYNDLNKNLMQQCGIRNN